MTWCHITPSHNTGGTMCAVEAFDSLQSHCLHSDTALRSATVLIGVYGLTQRNLSAG